MCILVIALATASVFIFAISHNPPISAATLEDLRKMVEQKNEEIRKLEEEAKKYKAEIATKQERGKSLKGEIARIQGTIRSLQNDIVITEAQIKKKELEIQETSVEISQKELHIADLRNRLGILIQLFFEQQQTSLIGMLLGTASMADFFRTLDYGGRISQKIVERLALLKELRDDLAAQKIQAEAHRNKTQELKRLLAMRHSALENQKQEQSTLLKVTQLQEKTFQALLTVQEKKRDLLEREMREIEEKIRITIDPASLPAKGTGVLAPPLPAISLASCWSGGDIAKNCVTQFFGYTDFAKAGGYSGNGHNGMDFRADIGASVLAVENGVVEELGDTDEGCRGASYGRWILIKHTNNLSTLYAHLSSVSVTKGHAVKRGEHIALSGKSGYATGPHLHFSVFATQGVQVESIRSKVCGTIMRLPIAAINAYIDPLDYL